MIELDKIYNEDCLEGMKRIADGAVDCIITDLPYEVLNDGNPNAQWDKMIPLEPLWEQFLRITKHNAAIVLFAQGMFTAQLMMSQPKIWRYNLVWDKMRATGFLNCHKAFLRQHEDFAYSTASSRRSIRRSTPFQTGRKPILADVVHQTPTTVTGTLNFICSLTLLTRNILALLLRSLSEKESNMRFTPHRNQLT